MRVCISQSARKQTVQGTRVRRAVSQTSVVSQHEQTKTFDIPQSTGRGHTVCHIFTEDTYIHVFLNRNGITWKSATDNIRGISELKRIDAWAVGICKSNMNSVHEHGKLRHKYKVFIDTSFGMSNVHTSFTTVEWHGTKKLVESSTITFGMGD
jgi:hypothetical protein